MLVTCTVFPSSEKVTVTEQPTPPWPTVIKPQWALAQRLASLRAAMDVKGQGAPVLTENSSDLK